MTKAQQWLTNSYPNKQQITKITFDGKILLEGDLVIEDFPNLDTITIPDCDYPERMSNLPKVQIRNCPQLKQVKINFFEVQNFSISSCPQVERLNLEDNSLTDLDISELTNLTSLDCSNNPLTSLDISNNLNLKTLECDDSLKSKILWKGQLLRWKVLTEWEGFKQRFRNDKEARLLRDNDLREKAIALKKEANRSESNPQWPNRFDILKSMINQEFWMFRDSGEATIEEVD